jgi:hypothetical protein
LTLALLWWPYDAGSVDDEHRSLVGLSTMQPLIT